MKMEKKLFQIRQRIRNLCSLNTMLFVLMVPLNTIKVCDFFKIKFRIGLCHFSVCIGKLSHVSSKLECYVSSVARVIWGQALGIKDPQQKHNFIVESI